MSQHDYVIANGTGAAVRSDLNGALAAIVSNNSGATAPSTTYAYQWWADTTTGLLKLRNAANNAWITLFQLDGEWSTLAVENGSASAPSIYFKDSGTDTGIYSPGADQVAISTNGSGRLFIDSSGRVGVGTGSPGARLDLVSSDNVAATTILNVSANNLSSAIQLGYNRITQVNSTPASAYLQLGVSNKADAIHIDGTGRVGIGTTTPTDTNSYGTAVDIRGSNTGNGGVIYLRNSDATVTGQLAVYGDGRMDFGTTTNHPLKFFTFNSERARIDSSGRLLVGTSSARGNLFSGSGSSQFQVEGTGTADRIISIVSSSSDGNAPPFVAFGKQNSGTVGGNTAVTSGNILGAVSFQGSDGTKFVRSAEISAEVDGTPGANDMPGRLVFSTTADGNSSPTERARITQAGYFKASSNGTYVSTTGIYHEFSNHSNDAVIVARSTIGSGYAGNVIYGDFNYVPNNTTASFLYFGDTSTVRMGVYSNGGIRNYQVNNVNLSDRNAKKDISPAADTWDCIKEWEIVNYRYKDQPDDADLNLGVIAQQVAESCPEVITVFEEAKEAKPAVLDEDGNEVEPAQEARPEKLGVKEQQMYWMAIKALQEAMSRIETLEAEVSALKAQ